MIVSKTISIELKDLAEIQEEINNEKVPSLSEFIQIAVKNELKRRDK